MRTFTGTAAVFGGAAVIGGVAASAAVIKGTSNAQSTNVQQEPSTQQGANDQQEPSTQQSINTQQEPNDKQDDKPTFTENKVGDISPDEVDDFKKRYHINGILDLVKLADNPASIQSRRDWWILEMLRRLLGR